MRIKQNHWLTCMWAQWQYFCCSLINNYSIIWVRGTCRKPLRISLVNAFVSSPPSSKNHRQVWTVQPVSMISQWNGVFMGCFGPKMIVFHIHNTYFLVWPNQYIGWPVFTVFTLTQFVQSSFFVTANMSPNSPQNGLFLL